MDWYRQRAIVALNLQITFLQLQLDDLVSMRRIRELKRQEAEWEQEAEKERYYAHRRKRRRLARCKDMTYMRRFWVKSWIAERQFYGNYFKLLLLL